MKEPLLLPVQPGSLSDYDRDQLRAMGVTVIEHENPSELRLLRPCSELDSSTLLRCAMKALAYVGDNFNQGLQQRAMFARFVAEAVDSKPLK